MAYDAVAQRWEFTGVTLVVPEVPKKEPAP
jgi:hypothetical protein